MSPELAGTSRVFANCKANFAKLRRIPKIWNRLSARRLATTLRSKVRGNVQAPNYNPVRRFSRFMTPNMVTTAITDTISIIHSKG